MSTAATEGALDKAAKYDADRYRDKAKRRFRDLVKEDLGCWHWRGATTAGTPMFSLAGRTTPARRAAWLLYHAEHVSPDHPDNRSVRVYRACTGELCVNPDHLTPSATHASNNEQQSLGRLRKWGTRLGRQLSASELSGEARFRMLGVYQAGNSDFLHLQAAFCTTPEGVMQVLTEELQLDADRPLLERFEELFPGQQYQDLNGF